MTSSDDRPVDEQVLDTLLASEAVWAELPPDLEDAVVDEIAAHRDLVPAPPSARRWRIATAVATLAAVAASIVAALVLTADPPARTFDSVTTLAATALADGGDARLEVTTTDGGTRLILLPSDLPPAADDEVYEGWMLDGRDVVSTGTFHLRGGDDVVWLWSGVPPEEFDLFVVTRHPIGSTARPSGPEGEQVVLHGRLNG